MEHIFNHWVSQDPLQSEIKSPMMLPPPVDRWSIHFVFSFFAPAAARVISSSIRHLVNGQQADFSDGRGEEGRGADRKEEMLRRAGALYPSLSRDVTIQTLH